MSVDVLLNIFLILDGASAIVVGHVFAACLTFAVFWLVTLVSELCTF